MLSFSLCHKVITLSGFHCKQFYPQNKNIKQFFLFLVFFWYFVHWIFVHLFELQTNVVTASNEMTSIQINQNIILIEKRSNDERTPFWPHILRIKILLRTGRGERMASKMKKRALRFCFINSDRPKPTFEPKPKFRFVWADTETETENIRSLLINVLLLFLLLRRQEKGE